uniref:RNA helicase n=1 Tax=Bracon brevicornis TaxID=1563983 RepID=A0A6V7M8J0_9HYME
MFSLMYAAARYVVSGFTKKEPDLDEIIDRFNKEFVNSAPEEPTTPVEFNLSGCFHQNGVVTAVNNEILIIDNVYVCSLANCPDEAINVGARVKYLAYQKTPKDEIKVRRVVSLLDTSWDAVEQEIERINGRQAENQLIKKVVVAKVIKREGRNVFLEPMNIMINLDSVDSNFVPYVGDWASIECFVQLDEESPDLTGSILEVERIHPLRSSLKVGIITEYDAKKGSGVVGNDTVFSKLACEAGYMPSVGDKVAADSIESDQGKYTWRCLSVVPITKTADTNDLKNSDADIKDQEELALLLQEKNGIYIDKDLNFTLDISEQKTLAVCVVNTGDISQFFSRGIFISKKSQSQLSLLSPNTDEKTILGPGEKMTFVFNCQAKFVGFSEELFIFCFKGFKIGRQFKINVNSKKWTNNPPEVVQGSKKLLAVVTPNDHDQENFVPGVRPFQPPRFITVRSQRFNAPQRLWNDVLCIVNRGKTQVEAEVMLSQTIPCLMEGLTIENYTTRFHALLYLEEISMAIDIQRYDMSNASMRHASEFLALKVPGLVEKRPSLIIGDRAVISFRWDSSKGNTKYEGWIHKITSNEIFLQFNPRFHETYNGEDCQVSFRSSNSGINRCHNAIELAVTHLTKEILFPTLVTEKEPQIILEEVGETKDESMNKKINENANSPSNGVEETQETLNELYLKKRKLKWFNKSLNIYQKNAVRNILLGVARPLPYVIFGPPGTGKTITLCETILQILTTLPESRLLIATPSNSSANLIAEKLIASGALKPGDLVRLIANHCLMDDSIPEELLPYCATANLAAEHSVRNRYDWHEGQNASFKVKCTTSVLGRHRITVGTCVALGILYNMGFPRGHFSHILVDEAGQATEPEIMIPLTFVHADYGQIILAGDPMQLGPMVNSKYATYLGLAESFLVRLLQQFPYQRDPEGFENGYDPRLVTKLMINYRSLPEILELPNELFYDSDLISNVDPLNSPEAKFLESIKDAVPVRTSGITPAIVFHGVNGENRQDEDSPSWYNAAEATQVYLYLLKLYSFGLTGDDIGIISPYQKQVKRIRDLLIELNVALPKVGSVEEFQGQERKIIIVSCVRSGQDHVKNDIKHALGFVASPMRLNVAITRARALLVILGNPTLLGQDPYWRRVLEYCVERDCYTGCNYGAVLKNQDNGGGWFSDN